MKFEEFKDLFKNKLGVEKLADIARELGVSPQVLNNWKAKNKVPYKYVKLSKERIKEEIISTASPLNTYGFFDSSADDQNENIIQELIDLINTLYKAIKNDFKIFLIFPLLALIVGFAHLKNVDSKYTSKMKILPLSSGGSPNGALGIAAQFGFDLGSNQSSNMFSAALYPEILVSRNFMRRMLILKFNTSLNGSQSKDLLEILSENKSKPKDGWHENDFRSGVNNLLRNVITVKKPKMSPVISISITTNIAQLSKDIGDSIISQLGLAFSEYKTKKVNERIYFIKNRLSEIESSLITSEEALKNFREKNRSILDSPTLLLKLERLNREVSLHNQIFLSLSSELEIEQINQHGVEKTFEVLDFPENMGRTYPKSKMFLSLYIIVGFSISVVIILYKNLFKNSP
jgi:hypothetical protein